MHLSSSSSFPPRRLRSLLLLLPGLMAIGLPSCKSSHGSGAAGGSGVDLKTARAGFITHLIRETSEKEPAPKLPDGVCDLIHYASPAGELAAYISKDPKDGGKHPLVIWITGGFGNSISPGVWADDTPVDNDQSAAAYRHTGLAMMYPSLRGGNDNPGHKEGLYGEVDDVLAAADYAAKLPWVDPQRIYLGGHSTGGTLALLTAEADGDERFRAVIAFGPVDSVSGYGQENLPYDIHDAKETKLRAPVNYLSAIKAPTLIVEGESGNSDSLKELKRRNKNANLSFTLASGYSHFSVLAPANAVLAKKLKEDTGGSPDLSLSSEEIKASSEALLHSRLIPAGDVRNHYCRNDIVFYWSAAANSDLDTLRKAMQEQMPDIPVISGEEQAKKPPFLLLTEEQAPFKTLALPPEDYFKFMGGGMSAEEVQAVLHSTRAIAATLVAPSDDAFTLGRRFTIVAGSYAEARKAYLLDQLSRRFYSVASWKQKRTDTWPDEGPPDLRTHISLQLYRPDDDHPELRIVTAGMEKFGLPDIVIPQCMPTSSRSASSLVNVVCQELALRPKVADPASFRVDLARIAPKDTAESYRKTIIGQGKGALTLSLQKGQPDEGDNDNNQIALDFHGSTGRTDAERRDSALSEMWGSADRITRVKHDDREIQKASQRAKEKLKALALLFKDGPPDRVTLQVKAPFISDDGKESEWMWVEVQEWKEGQPIHGLLNSDPGNIKTLRSGSKVTVKPEEIFDYILEKSDGTREGNETGALIEERSRRSSVEQKAAIVFEGVEGTAYVERLASAPAKIRGGAVAS